MNRNAIAIQDLQLQPDGVFGLAMPGRVIQLGSVGAVIDYDTIRVGGGTYSVNQIVDKSIRANKDTKLYKGARTNSEVIGIVKAGDIIGRVYSYLRPDQTTDGKSWLMFEKTYNNFYYVQNEAANTSDLKDQGALTVKEEVKKEEIEKFKEESPVEYYIKKYATKVIIGIGLIVLASTVGRTLVTEGIKKIGSKKSEPTPTPALAGVKKKREQQNVKNKSLFNLINMATKKKQASVITGLVVLRSKTADSENDTIALSIASQDAQDIDLEVLVVESDDELKVDQLYNAIITKGKGEGLNFKVTYLNGVDRGKYDERMVINGDISGHLNLNVLEEQDNFFHEGKEYSIIFEEVSEEEEEEEEIVVAVKKVAKKVAAKKAAKEVVMVPVDVIVNPVLPEGEIPKG